MEPAPAPAPPSHARVQPLRPLPARHGWVRPGCFADVFFRRGRPAGPTSRVRAASLFISSCQIGWRARTSCTWGRGSIRDRFERGATRPRSSREREERRRGREGTGGRRARGRHLLGGRWGGAQHGRRFGSRGFPTRSRRATSCLQTFDRFPEHKLPDVAVPQRVGEHEREVLEVGFPGRLDPYPFAARSPAGAASRGRRETFHA